MRRFGGITKSRFNLHSHQRSNKSGSNLFVDVSEGNNGKMTTDRMTTPWRRSVTLPESPRDLCALVNKRLKVKRGV